MSSINYTVSRLSYRFWRRVNNSSPNIVANVRDTVIGSSNSSFSGEMAFLREAMDRWAEVESPELDNLIWKLYGPTLIWGNMLSSWKPNRRLRSTILMIWYFSVVVFHLCLMTVSLVLEFGDVSVSSLILHYMILGLSVASCMSVFQWKRKALLNLHYTFLTDMWTYSSGRIYDDEGVKDIQRQIDGETKKLVLLPTGLLVVAVGGVVIVPLIKNSGNDELYRPSGLSMSLPMTLWYPYETHSGASYALTVGLQLATAGTLGIASLGGFLMLYHVCQKIRFEYRVLSYSVSTIMERALRLCKEHHPHRLQHPMEDYDPVYQFYVGICLKDSVLHHRKISEMINDFKDLGFWAITFAYMTGIAVIGLSLVNIIWLWKIRDYENVAVFAALLVCETVNMLIISAFGEVVSAESKDFRNHLYFMDWHRMNKKNRKVLFILHTCVTEPVIVQTGLFMDVCLDTFTNIINSAFSFFNLMNVGIE